MPFLRTAGLALFASLSASALSLTFYTDRAEWRAAALAMNATFGGRGETFHGVVDYPSLQPIDYTRREGQSSPGTYYVFEWAKFESNPIGTPLAIENFAVGATLYPDPLLTFPDGAVEGTVFKTTDGASDLNLFPHSDSSGGASLPTFAFGGDIEAEGTGGPLNLFVQDPASGPQYIDVSHHNGFLGWVFTKPPYGEQWPSVPPHFSVGGSPGQESTLGSYQVRLSNLSIGVVPEPTSLLALGLGGGALLSRRNRR